MPAVTDLGAEKLRYLSLGPYFTVEPKTRLGGVIALMKMMRAGCILVTEGEQPVGLFSERDVLTKVVDKKVDYRTPVSEFMSSDPRTLTQDDLIQDAISLIIDAGSRHIPLVDKDGKRAGLINVTDIVTYIAEHYPDEVFNLPPRLHQEMSRPEGG